MTFGFIILRNVQNVITNNYWIECYYCIRRFYPYHKIVIIDDNSNYYFIDTNVKLTNTIIIQSEYKKRGELLPYIYFLQYKWFDKAVILHDSVFIQKYIPFEYFENQSLWYFQNSVSRLHKEETKFIQKCKNSHKLLKIYNENKWKGCFGGMTIIHYSVVLEINEKFHIFSTLLKYIKTRQDRMYFERILGVVLYYYHKKSNNTDNNSVFGNIQTYCEWGYTYQMYIDDKIDKKIPELPLIKCWTGR